MISYRNAKHTLCVECGSCGGCIDLAPESPIHSVVSSCGQCNCYPTDRSVTPFAVTHARTQSVVGKIAPNACYCSCLPGMHACVCVCVHVFGLLRC